MSWDPRVFDVAQRFVEQMKRAQHTIWEITDRKAKLIVEHCPRCNTKVTGWHEPNDCVEDCDEDAFLVPCGHRIARYFDSTTINATRVSGRSTQLMTGDELNAAHQETLAEVQRGLAPKVGEMVQGLLLYQGPAYTGRTARELIDEMCERHGWTLRNREKETVEENAAQKAYEKMREKLEALRELKRCPPLKVTVYGSTPQELLTRAIESADQYYGLGEDEGKYMFEWYNAEVATAEHAEGGTVLRVQYECDVLIGVAR